MKGSEEEILENIDEDSGEIEDSEIDPFDIEIGIGDED